MQKKPPKPATSARLSAAMFWAVGDRIVPLLFEKNGRARRIIIRLDHGGGIVVVLPARATKEDGRRFALSNKGWIQERLAHIPNRSPSCTGSAFPSWGSITASATASASGERSGGKAAISTWRAGQSICPAGSRTG